jgi:hypothetical protein
MKTLILLLFVSLSASAQTSYLGLASSSYYTVNGGKLSQVHKPIVIIYSSRSASLYIEGRGTVYFPVYNFTSSLGHESFISDETDVAPRGQYDVMIDRTKDGNTVTVNIPSMGAAYIIEKARVYSANGEVTGMIDAKASAPHEAAKPAPLDSAITWRYTPAVASTKPAGPNYDSLRAARKLRDDAAILAATGHR